MRSLYELKNASRHSMNIAEMFYEEFQRFKMYALTDVQRTHISFICNPTFGTYDYCHGYIQEVYQRMMGFRFACMSIINWEYGYMSPEYKTLDTELNNLGHELLQRMRSVTDFYVNRCN